MHQTELRAQEVQSEYAREGWNSLQYAFTRLVRVGSVEVMKWVGSMMREWPHRVLPVVGGDANTWIGRRSDGREAMAEVVGPFHRGKQTSAGDLLLDSMETLGFVVPASFVTGGGPTHCGTQGSTSSTDHFQVPKEAKILLGKVSVCWRLERALQLAPCQQRLDHMPLLMELHHTFIHKSGQKTERIAWNFDKLAAALQSERGRVEFLEDLQNTLQREKGNIAQHSEERARDNHWSAWMTTLQWVALRLFSRDKRTDCEVTKRASLERAERRRLGMTAGAQWEAGGRVWHLVRSKF